MTITIECAPSELIWVLQSLEQTGAGIGVQYVVRLIGEK